MTVQRPVGSDPAQFEAMLGQIVGQINADIGDVTVRALGSPALPSGTNLDDFDTPRTDWVAGSFTNVQNVPPTGSSFIVRTYIGSATARVQVAHEVGLALTVWARFRGSVGWTAWKRIDAEGVLAQANAYADSVTGPTTAARPGSGFKTVPVALTAGGPDAAYGVTTAGVRMPMDFAPTISRWRVHVRNINPRTGGNQNGAVDLTGLWFGAHNGTGGFTGTPTQIVGAVSTGTDGSEYVSPWVSTPIGGGASFLLAYGFSASSATRSVVGGGWRTTAAADAANNAATKTLVTTMPLDVWIEAEVPTSVPVVASAGDSLSVGVGSALPVRDSFVSQYARAHAALPMHYGSSGDAASAALDPAAFKWSRWQSLAKPDAVLVQMGSNDIFAGGSTLTTTQQNYQALLALVAAKVSSNVYATTLLPRDAVTGAQESTRRSFNLWLLSGATPARDVFDFVPGVSSDNETLTPALTADGIHLTTAGYAATAAAITREVAPQLAQGPQGQQGPAGVADDGSVAALLAAPSSTRSAADARYPRRDFAPVNVKEYGAVGNGSADDTAAIDAAQAVANAGYGRPLYFPNGTYLYGGAGLTAKVIIGESRQKTWIKYTGAGSAVAPLSGQINYHRKISNVQITGLGAGSSAIGLDLDTTPSGHFDNLIISGFTTGISFTATMGLSSSLYNVFDDVTVQSCTTGVLMDGIANSNRFDKFRINQCTTGFDLVVAGQNVITSSAIENCTTGLRVRGDALNKANVAQSTRFEFCTTTYQTDAGSEMSAFVACRFIGGVKVDNGRFTVDVDLATGTYRGRGAAFVNNDASVSTPTLTVVNAGTGDAIQADGGFAVTKAGHVKTLQFYNPASFANARVQLNSSGTVVDRNVGDNATTFRINQVHASATGDIQQWQAQSVTTARITRAGHHVIAKTAAPADGDLVAGELAFWFDSTNGAARLMVKAKQADGTVRTGSVNLT